MSPPPISTMLIAVLAALAGFCIGKTSTLRAVGRIQDHNQHHHHHPSDKSPSVQARDDTSSTGPATSAEGDTSHESEARSDEDWEDASGEVSQFEGVDEECKMVLVVRPDLGMTKGKIAAQCSHATLMCYKAAVRHAPGLVRRWETHGQTKIALQGRAGGGEEELEVLQATAVSLGVVAGIVRDAGRTQIKAGSATVLGVGPAPRSVVDQVTGHLKLL